MLLRKELKLKVANKTEYDTRMPIAMTEYNRIQGTNKINGGRKMSRTNAQVCHDFVSGTKEHSQSHSITQEGNTFHSYSTLYAVKLDNGTFIVNADTYSNTTSKHVSALLREMIQEEKAYAVISYRLLRNLGIDVRSDSIRNMIRLHERAEDNRYMISEGDLSKMIDIAGEQVELTYENFDSVLRKHYGNIGQLHTYKAVSNSRGTQRAYKSFHIMGGCVFSVGVSKFWSGTDRTQAFICELPRDTYGITITDALKSLIPDYARRAMQDGKEVIRQGEYFFTPVANKPSGDITRDGLRWYELPTRKNKPDSFKGVPLMSTCHHTAKLAVECYADQFVSGYILDAQHRKTQLVDKQWYLVEHNRALQSTSTDRKID